MFDKPGDAGSGKDRGFLIFSQKRRRSRQSRCPHPATSRSKHWFAKLCPEIEEARLRGGEEGGGTDRRVLGERRHCGEGGRACLQRGEGFLAAWRVDLCWRNYFSREEKKNLRKSFGESRIAHHAPSHLRFRTPYPSSLVRSPSLFAHLPNHALVLKQLPPYLASTSLQRCRHR